MTDLFTLPPSPSPRLKWMEKHDVHSHCCPDIDEAPWAAWQGLLTNRIEEDSLAYGMTEIEALQKLAMKLKLPFPTEV